MERHWPQHLYLSPSSPLIKFLNPPPGFNLSTTPLVTFRRVDLLLSKEELVDLHRELHNPPSDFSLFSEETLWSLPPSEYLALFQQSLPEANYRTMVVSTAGHWTTTVMAGYRDESLKDDGYGIHGVLDFFREAMTKWADEIQTALTNDMGTAGHRVKREVVVRAYLPGHEDCHSWREPWAKYHPFKWSWYNWGYIKDFNRVFSVCHRAPYHSLGTLCSRLDNTIQEVTSSRSYPDIHYLPIDRPALLRPDAVRSISDSNP